MYFLFPLLTKTWPLQDPFVVQAKNVPSTYYEDIFSGLPAGYENEDEVMWYDPDDFDLSKPPNEVFTNVLKMNCSAPMR